MSDAHGTGAVPPPEPGEADLLARLGRALAPAEVPGDLVEAARAALEWRRVDEHLAALTATEGATAGAVPAGVRGKAATGALTFAGPGWELEVEVRPAGGAGGPRLATGQVMPPFPGVVAWEARGASGTAVPLGPAGVFELGDVPAGPVRFVVTEEGGAPVRTDWVLA